MSCARQPAREPFRQSADSDGIRLALALEYYHNNAGQIIEVHKDGDDDHPLG